MKYHVLREFIAHVLLEKEELIAEPDQTDEEPKEEQVTTASIAGVTTPLGTGPRYPAPTIKKKKKNKKK